MFICDYCSTPAGPKVSPIVVFDFAQVRQRTYTNGEGDDAKVTKGWEVTAEYKKCPTCAGAPTARPDAPVDSTLVGRVSSMQEHAKKCKKPLDDCGMCRANVEAYKDMPINVMSKALEASTARRAHFSMAAVAVENLVRRSKHTTNRAALDFIAGYNTIKAFESRGGRA